MPKDDTAEQLEGNALDVQHEEVQNVVSMPKRPRDKNKVNVMDTKIVVSGCKAFLRRVMIEFEDVVPSSIDVDTIDVDTIDEDDDILD